MNATLASDLQKHGEPTLADEMWTNHTRPEAPGPSMSMFYEILILK